MGKFELFLELLLNEDRRLEILESLPQILLNLVKYLARYVRVQSQQLPPQVLVPVFVHGLINLHELVIRVTPALITFQLNKLLNDKLMLEGTDRSVSLCQAKTQVKVKQRNAFASKACDDELVN